MTADFRTPTSGVFNTQAVRVTLVVVIPLRSKAIDMKREQTISREDRTLASDTAQPPANEPAESGSKRFQPPAHLLKRVIRRPDLRKIVPLADTTIYEMEQRGEFPKRFFLTPRCVVWDLAEVETWLDERRRASDADTVRKVPVPNVRQRRSRPVKTPIQRV
ncbi:MULTISPECIES: helix-turn-helix transcriptional regulator [unclassified Bradyrhizobium]|uniref:helix-turn-helix transcriptional regulator n=1 Tax=unclassified Bradyrhizobium TaxID=2631580 RepID=UPI0029161E76|nr:MULTISPECIES: AlpA family phage regulatory protein [unclassified Bradyrhizobium]